ncbi:hypothetical protein [Acidaminobacter sp.]|uniref:hypothetical protein n=1 Tax=Acidaminobacter sp. TaxID=1872102 RepID=UPI0025688453|nr:hypothetical protein [Acidaminobacter sp.]MDK9710363.1 hypothetical protein [Acidaminobacter sp.]
MIQDVLERVKAAEALADGRLSEARTEAEAILKAAKLKAEAMVKDVSVQHVKLRTDACLKAEEEAEHLSGPVLEAARHQSEEIRRSLQDRVEAAAEWAAERIVR